MRAAGAAVLLTALAGLSACAPQTPGPVAVTSVQSGATTVPAPARSKGTAAAPSSAASAAAPADAVQAAAVPERMSGPGSTVPAYDGAEPELNDAAARQAAADASVAPVGVQPTLADKAPAAVMRSGAGASAGSDAPNPVEYALKSTNPKGNAIYERSGSPNLAACSAYGSDLAAQQAFLAAGGPRTDRYGLDPDGDGYACRFDPSVYRQAVGN